MRRMYETFVAIDLETTGIDPSQDRIIEVGAVIYKWQGFRQEGDSRATTSQGEIVARFSELIRCPVALAPGIIKLTGITPAMLEGKRELDTVLADFLDFLPEGALCIAHNANFDRSFLRAATQDRFRHTVLDTVGLSRVCFPELPSHGLEYLREALSLASSAAHRALADCETLVRLWAALLTRALEIPLPVVNEMNYLLAAHRRHPFFDFFQRLEKEALTRQFGRAQATLEEVFRKKYSPPPPPQDSVADTEPKKLDEENIAQLLGRQGKFAQKLKSYEYRDGQIKMARAIAAAFNGEKHLLVEAGTGIGKSLAYLVPAVLWATTNNTPVVVSTNTKNLQAQLFYKDLPCVREALDLDFKSAIIKGRGNYLCLRKLVYALRQAQQELTVDERMQLLTILPWAAWTDTGDISENIISGRPGFHRLWAKISAAGSECTEKSCRQYRCFLHRARAQAQAADVVVANHSLVFAEMNMPRSVLPPYAQIVFDEAHNLEDAATSHLSVEMSCSRITRALRRLFRAGRRGSGTGLIPSLESKLRESKADADLCAQALKQATQISEALEGAETATAAFFPELEPLLKGSKYGSNARFYAERKQQKVWRAIQAAQVTMIAALGKVIQAAEALADSLREMEPGELEFQREFVRGLETAAQWLREITADVEFVLEAGDEKYVFWVERVSPRENHVRAWAAPKEVGALLYDQVYARKKTVVFSSATLSVRGDFAFLKKRLGIGLIPPERLLELDAGTPFDYPRQCLVAAPTFLPEPGERSRDYAKELAVLLSEVFRRTRGRALTLFTSYDMLRKTLPVLEQELAGDGIQILAQGSSGSRENITAIFKRDTSSVLLGTDSFWEGVDVVGEALSCLTIARLPFQVFTEPIIEARCEQVEAEGGNAFLNYSLPSAVIRFRQGFGRLIRHQTDRGIVIIADRRVVVKRYGKWFRDSLPVPLKVFPDREEFLDAIEAFLKKTPATPVG